MWVDDLNGFRDKPARMRSNNIVLSFDDARELGERNQLREGALGDIEESYDASSCCCSAYIMLASC